jgi:hypothetical protein
MNNGNNEKQDPTESRRQASFYLSKPKMHTRMVAERSNFHWHLRFYLTTRHCYSHSHSILRSLQHLISFTCTWFNHLSEKREREIHTHDTRHYRHLLHTRNDTFQTRLPYRRRANLSIWTSLEYWTVRRPRSIQRSFLPSFDWPFHHPYILTSDLTSETTNTSTSSLEYQYYRS